MGKITKILSCLVIGMLLMSAMPVSVFASANSNISSDGVNITQSTSHTNAKSLKDGIHILSPDLVLTRADYNMSIAVEDVVGIGRYTEATADGKKLLYGYPDPGTSYTTIRVDGNDYCQNDTMDSYVTQMPTIVGDSIITKWSLPPNVDVSQDLTLLRNTTQYRLTVTNNDHASHHVKVRYLFDTMLAYEDGAPFRVPGVGDITTEQEFENPVFNYWKATDSLANPTLTSNCTFVPSNKPDKVQFAYWHDIVKVPFDYTITEGRDITSDTAVGMYWDLGTLTPGKTKDVTAYYGTGFIPPPPTITKIQIIDLFTEYDSYLSGQNVRIYAYSGNFGDVPLVDGQLAINITNPKAELVFENVSAITINPDQTISPCFTYNLPLDAVGGVYTINAAVYDAEMNLLDQEETTFRFTTINLSISPKQVTTSIGGSAKYVIRVKNPSEVAVPLNLSLSGLEDSWYTLSKESLILNAGGEEAVILNVKIPESPDNTGEYNFNVSAAATSASAVLDVVLEPLVYDLSPPDAVILSSNDLLFSWKTSVKSTTELYIKQETEADFIKVTGESGLEHSVTVENLTRNTNYVWYAKSCTSFACGISDNRAFYIDNGIVFTKDRYDFTVERDYDQPVSVSVKNMDSEPHDLLVRANNPYNDLFVGFVGGGSIDKLISLNPGETKDIKFVIHAQDSMLEEYTFTANLTNIGTENITDYALIHVNIKRPNIDFTITEVSTNPRTLVKTYKVQNHGDPITDFKVSLDDAIKDSVYLQPEINHGYLKTGDSIDVNAIPLFSEECGTIEGNIIAEGARESKSVPANFECSEGTELFLGHIDNPLYVVEIKDWYCINNPEIDAPFFLPVGFNADDVIYEKLFIDFSLPWDRSTYAPHNVYITINGKEVGKLMDSIPEGRYSFDLDPSVFNYAEVGKAVNKIHIHTVYPTYAHFVSSTHMRIQICLEDLERWVCASTQEEADASLWEIPGIQKPSSTMNVGIISPSEGDILALGKSTLIRASVTGDYGAELYATVKATFSNSDLVLELKDEGIHGDGKANDGVYANSWIPEIVGGCEVTVSANDCVASGSDSVMVVGKVGGAGAVDGYVRDSVTNEPIREVVVCIGMDEYYDQTDSAGHYLIENIPEGTYVIHTSKSGYTKYYGEIEVIGDLCVPKDIQLTLLSFCKSQSSLRRYSLESGAWYREDIACITPYCIASGDADNDGIDEVVIGSKNKLFIFEYNLDLGKWEKTEIYSYDVIIQNPLIKSIEIGDANNDGKNEIIIGTSSLLWKNQILLFKKGVNKKWEKEIIAIDVKGNIEAISIGDADNDNENEVVVAACRKIAIIPVGDNYIISFKYEKASKKWIRNNIEVVARIPLYDEIINDIAIGDSNGDEENEIIVGKTVYLHVPDLGFLVAYGAAYTISFSKDKKKTDSLLVRTYLAKGVNVVKIASLHNSNSLSGVFVGLDNGEVIRYSYNNGDWIVEGIPSVVSRWDIKDIEIGRCNNDLIDEVIIYSGYYSGTIHRAPVPARILVYNYVNGQWLEINVKDIEYQISSGALCDPINVELNSIIVGTAMFPPLQLFALSPVDLIITDPDKLSINKQSLGIPYATYSEIDLDGDGALDDLVIIPNPKIGNYTITVVPEPDAYPTDTYTLSVSIGYLTTILAENVSISKIPPEPYIFKSGMTQPPSASFSCSPENPVVNQSITFNASSSYDPDGYIPNYEWDFGDGIVTNITEPIITHSYALAGNYIVNLKVTDNDGAFDAEAKNVTVSGGKIIYVDDDFADDPANHKWNTIIEGIIDANEGDTIIVRDGIYTENIDVIKPHLTIKSENGADCTIVQAANPDDTVFEVMADHVNIRGFTVKGATGMYIPGIYLNNTDYCDISNNVIANNHFGIALKDANNNALTSNNVKMNDDFGISLINCNNNALTDNKVESNNWIGLVLYYGDNNTLIGNTMSGNRYNFGSFSINDNIDKSNLVDGKPIYHIKGASNIVYDSTTDIGTLYCINCKNITVRDLNLRTNTHGVNFFNTSNSKIENVKSSDNWQGILLDFSSSNNTLINNDVSYNEDGISIYSSNNNIIEKNSISNNRYGLRLISSSNCFYLNNFINNVNKVHLSESTNIWNSPSKISYAYDRKTYKSHLGNYWDDYTGSDANGDGIGDIPYIIDSDKDIYPLMQSWEQYFQGSVYIIGDEEFPKRKPITIDNTRNANTLTDYQVKLDVIYEPEMQPDFDDLRFTDSSNIILNYWVEDYIPDARASVWVKIPLIPGSGTTTVYMYYGNPSASSQSNGDATFDIFEDFDVDDGEWTEYDPNNKIELDYTTDHGLEFNNWIRTDPGYVVKSYTTRNFVEEYDIDITNYWGNANTIGPGFSDTFGTKNQWQNGAGTEFYAGFGDLHSFIMAFVDGNKVWGHSAERPPHPNSIDVNTNTPYYVRLEKFENTVKLSIFSDPDRTTHIAGSPKEVTTDLAATNFNYYYLVTGYTASPPHNPEWTTGWMDNFKVRKYASPEPTITVGGVDPSPLLDGVYSLCALGVPGPLSALNSAPVPVVAGDNDTTPVPSIVVMASGLGNGRVVAFSGGFFHNDAIKVYDNKRFANNVIDWLDKLGRKKVMITRGHREWGSDSMYDIFKAELESRGYTVTRFSGTITPSVLSDVGVVLIGTAWGTVLQSEIDALTDFVTNGGGLFLTGLGWSWEPYNPPYTLDEYPMNNIAAPYGIRWIDGYIRDPTNNYEGQPIFHTFYPNIRV